MSGHLPREIDKLNKRLLSLSTLVEESVHLAVRSVLERSVDLAEQVLQKNQEIDRFEVEVEEECLKLLALHQPVAIDLRRIIAVLKMNNDLERIGDLAANITARSLALMKIGSVPAPFDLPRMSDKVKTMLRWSLEALVRCDVDLARAVCSADVEVDDMNRENFRRIQDEIRKDSEQVEQMIMFSSVSRCLERIADLTTNISEDVIYMVEGEIVRHQWNKLSKR